MASTASSNLCPHNWYNFLSLNSKLNRKSNLEGQIWFQRFQAKRLQESFDFEGSGFKGFDFKGSDFKGFEFKGFDFKGSDFKPTDLEYLDSGGFAIEGFGLESFDFKGFTIKGFNFKGFITKSFRIQIQKSNEKKWSIILNSKPSTLGQVEEFLQF